MKKEFNEAKYWLLSCKTTGGTQREAYERRLEEVDILLYCLDRPRTDATRYLPLYPSTMSRTV